MKALALALALVAAVGCCPVTVKSIEQVENSVKISRDNHLKYIEADPKLKAEDKEDWKKFYQSQLNNIGAIKKAHE